MLRSATRWDTDSVHGLPHLVRSAAHTFMFNIAVSNWDWIVCTDGIMGRSRCPCDLRCESDAIWVLRSAGWGHACSSVVCCVRGGLCDELVASSEECFRLRACVSVCVCNCVWSRKPQLWGDLGPIWAVTSQKWWTVNCKGCWIECAWANLRYYSYLF